MFDAKNNLWMLPMTLMTPINIIWDLHNNHKFSLRHNNHKSSFHNNKQKNSTELSKYVCSLINEKKYPIIN